MTYVTYWIVSRNINPYLLSILVCLLRGYHDDEHMSTFCQIPNPKTWSLCKKYTCSSQPLEKNKREKQYVCYLFYTLDQTTQPWIFPVSVCYAFGTKLVLIDFSFCSSTWILSFFLCLCHMYIHTHDVCKYNMYNLYLSFTSLFPEETNDTICSTGIVLAVHKVVAELCQTSCWTVEELRFAFQPSRKTPVVQTT